MLATTHPDATAFTARFLANPQDRLGRLVFADWLEEQGGESNLAWAQYLRFMAQAEEESDNEFVQHAANVGWAVRARLTLREVPGTSLLSRLTVLLPDHRIWLKFDKTVEIYHWLGTGPFSPFAWGFIPEVTCREFSLLPLGQIEGRFHAVAACPHTSHNEIREEVTRVSGQPCVLFRGELDVIQTVILRAFGDWSDPNR